MRKLIPVFSAVLILAGISLAAYPIVSNMLAKRNASEAIVDYSEQVESMDQEHIDAAKEAMRQYNEQLGHAVIREAAGEMKENGTSYVDMIGAGEIIGYLTVPVIDLNLPIYYGTSNEVLEKGVGYIEETSFPLGGEGTHSVLTGHRGLPSAELFTRMGEVKEKDTFYLHILDEVLAYEVDQILVVDPDDTSELDIVEGKDYVTLVTCTPYSINTHRLLVRGHRIEYTGEESVRTVSQVQPAAMARRMIDVWPWFLFMMAGVAGIELLLIMGILWRRHRRKKKERNDKRYG